MTYEMEELLPVVAKLAAQYTGLDSTSISYETAQQLLEAVLYCIDEYETDCGSSEMTAARLPAVKAYQLGYEKVTAKVQALRTLYRSCMAGFDSYGSQYLSDTLEKGIPGFLKWYDPKFEPQNTILTLDYPILTDLCRRSGIDAVFEYVCAVTLEQKFLSRFDKAYILSVRNGYDRGDKAILINLCEIVLQNAIGHVLIQKPFSSYGFTPDDYEKIKAYFQNCPKEEQEIKLSSVLNSLTDLFYEKDETLLAYLQQAVPNLASRLQFTIRYHTWEQLFYI